MRFCDVLKKLREEKNLSQEELAKALNLSKSTIGMYELGRRMPKKDSVLKSIARYFSVSLDYLLGFDAELVDDIQELTAEEKKLLSDYRHLNSSGQDKAREYIADLVNMDKYVKQAVEVLNNEYW